MHPPRPRSPARHARRAAALTVMALLLAGGRTDLRAAPPATQFDTFESRSQQFSVTGLRPGIFIGLPNGSLPPTNYIRLEPAVVVVNCERVKEALLRELRLKDQWHGHIRVSLVPDLLPTQPITVNREWYRDGWHYHLIVPHFAEPVPLARAITGALLIELANRGNLSGRSGDVPLWAIEGMTAHLLASGRLIFLNGVSAPVPGGGRLGVVNDPRALLQVSARLPDEYQAARARLQPGTALSFNDLSLPRPEQLAGAAREAFRGSAHVFVAELLKLTGGPANFTAFLQQLPNYLNAQLAFERAFGNYFRGALDIEKWWSLTLVNVIGRDAQRRWAQPTSLDRLDDLLRARVERRAGANALPERQFIKLQQFLGQTEFARERIALAELVAQLTALQNQASPELARLIADYRRVLENYLSKRQKAGEGFSIVNRMAPSHRIAVQETVRQLDMLDVIRDDFRRYDPGTATAAK